MVGNTEKTGQPLAVNRPKRNRLTRDDLELSLLGLPAFIWYALFSYLPMFGLIIAFKQYKIFPRQSFLYNLFHSEFVGFKNFSFFIHNLQCIFINFYFKSFFFSGIQMYSFECTEVIISYRIF